MDPDSAVSEVQRRIELQSPEDLTYLITNVRNAAAARLNEAFPPVEDPDGGEDLLRNQIEASVNEFIDRTFSLAAPNLSINGLPVDPAPFLAGSSPTAPNLVYEPFDARKRRAVADLITQEEKLLEDVAALKRSVPANAAAEHADRIRSAIKQDEEDLRSRVESDAAAAAAAAADGMSEGGAAAGIKVEDLSRQEDVEVAFRDAALGLGRLKRVMPAVVAKMERARLAGEYVVTTSRQ